MKQRAVVRLRRRLEREFYCPAYIFPDRGKEVERLIEEAAEQIAAEKRGDDYRKLSPRSKKLNARDVAILGGDPSL